jgi:hypothetical protein
MDEARGDARTNDIQRSLGRVEASLESLRTQGADHQKSDDREFRDIRGNFLKQDERFAALEGICDTVEGHGAAIVDLERRIEKRETREVEHDAIQRTNLKWLRIGAIVAFSVAAKIYWPDLAQLASGALFK